MFHFLVALPVDDGKKMENIHGHEGIPSPWMSFLESRSTSHWISHEIRREFHGLVSNIRRSFSPCLHKRVGLGWVSQTLSGQVNSVGNKIIATTASSLWFRWQSAGSKQNVEASRRSKVKETNWLSEVLVLFGLFPHVLSMVSSGLLGESTWRPLSPILDHVIMPSSITAVSHSQGSLNNHSQHGHKWLRIVHNRFKRFDDDLWWLINGWKMVDWWLSNNWWLINRSWWLANVNYEYIITERFSDTN